MTKRVGNQPGESRSDQAEQPDTDRDNTSDGTGLPNRDGRGRFLPAADAAERDAKALRMRAGGATLEAIGKALGYGHPANVLRVIKKRTGETLKPAVDEYRRSMDSSLDELEAACMKVLEANHVRIHDGEAVTLEGERVTDDAPVLAATQAILKIHERRAKLWGLDAPVKTEVGVHAVKYTVDGVDMDKV